MASTYGLNFGFRRSDESVRTSEGRFRTPKTGANLLLGTAVEIDPANPGYLKVAAANSAPVTGVRGLLVQEEQHIRSIYDSQYLDTFGFGVAYKDTLSVITGGAGVKVWFKNSTAQTRQDLRSVAGVNIVDLTGVALGDKLGWDGTKWVKSTATVLAWMTVTDINASTGYVEAVLVA